MDASIIICTSNRAQSLRPMRESLKEVCAPQGFKWEVIVVDNNSTDGTRLSVEEFSRAFPLDVRYMVEPRQVLSRARNRDVQEAAGDFILFLDDDVIVLPTWLQETMKAFDQSDLGRKDRQLQLGEETDLVQRALLDG